VEYFHLFGGRGDRGRAHQRGNSPAEGELANECHDFLPLVYGFLNRYKISLDAARDFCNVLLQSPKAAL
jgi:hypothetical protein